MNYGPTFAVRRRLGLRWPNSRPPLAHSVPHFILAGMVWIAALNVIGWLQERDLADRAQASQECRR